MVKTGVTLSIDHEIKAEAKKLLEEKGITLSFYVEQVLRKFIEQEQQPKSKNFEGKKNGFISKKKDEN